jgi:hypothetical protein
MCIKGERNGALTEGMWVTEMKKTKIKVIIVKVIK